MNRRRVLGLTASTAIATGLAGCSEDDADYENGGDDDGNGGGNGNGDDEPSSDDIEIVEHDMNIDEGQFTTDITIEGVVENNSDERASYVEVTARVYDADGNQLDSYIDNTNDLDSGATWAFEIMVLEDAEDVDDYDIAVEDSSW